MNDEIILTDKEKEQILKQRYEKKWAEMEAEFTRQYDNIYCEF